MIVPLKPLLGEVGEVWAYFLLQAREMAEWIILYMAGKYPSNPTNLTWATIDPKSRSLTACTVGKFASIQGWCITQ